MIQFMYLQIFSPIPEGLGASVTGVFSLGAGGAGFSVFFPGLLSSPPTEPANQINMFK